PYTTLFRSAGGVGRADRLADQVAVHDAPDLDGQPLDVDRLDADAVGLFARQDHALAGEADVGGLLAEGEGRLGVLRQHLAVAGWQTLQQGDGAVGEADAGDAQFRALDGHRRFGRRLRRDQHEVAVGLGRVQRPAHLDAGARLWTGA